MLNGISVSPGVAIGAAYVFTKQQLTISAKRSEDPVIDVEIGRLKEAVDMALAQLEQIISEAEVQGREKAAEIVDAQINILMDEEFLGEIYTEIRHGSLHAENALELIVNGYAAKLEKMKDLYLQERAADIRDTGRRILANLLDVELPDLRSIPSGSILIAEELSPSQAAQLPKERVAGLCVKVGGKTSHVAIMAKSLGIPAIVGVEGMESAIKTGDYIILDAQTGKLLTSPSAEEITEYSVQRQAYQKYVQKLRRLIHLPAVTQDNQHLARLSANIALPEEAGTALEQGAEGIGLYRTEFLYMDCLDFPSEEIQFKAYRQVAEAMAPRPVTIRTLDIGGDKELPYFQFPKESNPFLGWRAIRFCLDNPQIFRTQLRAILRASHYGNVRLMYPMISTSEELRAANLLLDQAKLQLRAEDIPFDEKMEIGAMVEVPSAAVCVDFLLKDLDFLCIGTNDLIQYTLAADRLNEKIAETYQAFHPAVLRLIKHVIETAHARGKHVSVCGEMAGSVSASPILIGLGLKEFSMNAGALLYVKNVIRGCRIDEARNLAAWALEQTDGRVIQHRMQEFLKQFED